jgi:hypothetical protein
MPDAVQKHDPGMWFNESVACRRLTRCRPYRENDQAWVEQKNGAVVRRIMGYRRFEGLEAAACLAAAQPALTSTPALRDRILDDGTGQPDTPPATALRADRAQ